MTTPNLPLGMPVADLPQGVFHKGNLGGVLQDSSADKYRSLAAGRFPSIVGGTSAGDPGDVGGPLGFVVDLFSKFTENVATADPSTVNHPDDLLPFITDFFDDLPVEVVVYVLALLLSWLTDTDPEDWDTVEEIQANLVPALIQLPLKILGALLGGGSAGQLDQATRDALGPLVEIFDTVAGIQNFVQNLIDTLASVFGLIPIVGGGLADIVRGVESLKSSIADLSDAVAEVAWFPQSMSKSGDDSIFTERVVQGWAADAASTVDNNALLIKGSKPAATIELSCRAVKQAFGTVRVDLNRIHNGTASTMQSLTFGTTASTQTLTVTADLVAGDKIYVYLYGSQGTVYQLDTWVKVS